MLYVNGRPPSSRAADQPLLWRSYAPSRRSASTQDWIDELPVSEPA
jgi:hypothetical protein